MKKVQKGKTNCGAKLKLSDIGNTGYGTDRWRWGKFGLPSYMRIQQLHLMV